MRDTHSQSVRAAPYAMLFIRVLCAAVSLLLASCSADLPVQREAQQAKEDVLPTQYSIVCVIHGDSDYLYHDTSGNEFRADEEALAGARNVALQNPRAEVFIFHQRSRRHFLFFFPLRDGEFSYYRNGRLIVTASYWRDQEQSDFNPEVELYRRFGTGNQRETMRLFLYYGHEIPEFGGRGYDASYPDRPFTVDHLVTGLKGFMGDSTRFDLMVLSTCFGGTPHTIDALGSVARYIIASPDNLHLSYFDFHSLEQLELNVGNRDVPAFAARFARQAFDRLTSEVQTAVSIAVYDVDRVQAYTRAVNGVYDHSVMMLKGMTQASMATVEHCDCADVPGYVLPMMTEGVDVFYRSARFGRSKQKQNHSGWECWRERSVTSSYENGRTR
jgi:hypothetical protein